MGQLERLIDPFGAPEYFVDGVHRERICEALARLSFFANEGESRIVKVKLLMPIATIFAEQHGLAAFMTSVTKRVLM